MSSVETYVIRVKPAIENFIQQPNRENLSRVEKELKGFDFGQIRIFQIQILVPLVVKLGDLSDECQELRTSLLDCLRHIISKLYLTEEKALRYILVVILQQIRDHIGSVMRPDLSEEIKLAAVLCMTTALQRSTSDVLEVFYTQNSAGVIGQVLLTLIEFISKEKYRKLVNSSIEALMVVFYVHDDADAGDVVLRNQVANTIFVFLPKIVTVLFQIALSDEKVGESTKCLGIKSLGRITCIMFEETTDEFIKARYDVNAFKSLFNPTDTEHNKMDLLNDINMFGSKRFTLEQNEERLKNLQSNLRSEKWIAATAKHMRKIFVDTCILRAHDSVVIRRTYADMCCLLIRNCVHNLQCNFIHLLESVLALSEDEDTGIAEMCRATLAELQQMPSCGSIFDENAELLLDAHLKKWPRILQRCDDNEQFAELLFFKGFLRNVSAEKLHLLLILPKNLELFVMCLLLALDQRTSQGLLNEDFSLRTIQTGNPRELEAYCSKMCWRNFKYLSSKRSINVLYDIAGFLGAEPLLNRLLFDYCQELVERRSSSMNESILLMTLMITPQQGNSRKSRLSLVELFVDLLLAEEHWHLALQPDAAWRLKVEKPSAWFKDHTPGIHSAVEVRTQDCDSDDESEPVNSRVSISDAQFNVQHTCLVLDALGHCAKFIGDTFDRYIFRSLHRVLLKLASSNTMVHQAATFAFVSMQLALKYAAPSHFIECSTDYITFHLNSLLKKSPESNAAVDILTIVLQYSTRGSVPHLENIFRTIIEECEKVHQTENVNSFLRVFNAFLEHVSNWQDAIATEIVDTEMRVDEDQNILSTWLNVLNRQPCYDFHDSRGASTEDPDTNMPESKIEDCSDEQPSKIPLPLHIEIIKKIIHQSLKFLSKSEQTHQILALECLISGVPLLADYEDELLPLVHLMWQPLIEKFRQKDAIVLNRCFSLLHLLALHSKEFISKRSLSDVIPQLKEFLQSASNHSCKETSSASTQEYKLQRKLLRDLAEVIRSLQLEGKHLDDLLNIVALYLSQAQPTDLQTLAIQFYQNLFTYNGPFVYVTLLRRAHLKAYKTNVDVIYNSLGLTLAVPLETDINK